MNAIQSVTALTASLVHHSATRSVSDRSRHEAFIREKLLFAFASLAIAPFYLAFQGVPSPSDCAIFCLSLLPMVVAMLVARTGRIVAGHILMSAAMVAVGLTFFFGDLAGAGGAVSWFIAAQFEAMLAADRRVTRTASIIIGLLSACVLGAAANDLSVNPSPADGAIATVALLQTLLGAWGLLAANQATAARMKAKGDRWREVAEALGDLVVTFDGGGSVDRVSSACEGMLDLPSRDLVGRGLFDHVHIADRPIFLKLVGDAAHGEGTMSGTVRLRTGRRGHNPAGYSEPRHIWIEMRAKSLGQAGGRTAKDIEVVAILRDVTIARQHAIDLEQANQASETAIRAKDHFLANMSHELRTPLNAIIGFSEMLGSRTLRPVDQEKQREYAKIIHNSGQHLLAVVNSILDMSKIQSGTFAIIPEPFTVRTLIDQCCDMIRLEAQSGKVSLTCDVPDTLDEIVGDKRACKQILLNLLSNAVKFTPERGHVSVRARPEGNTLVICVSDTGIGIAATDLACLGDPFFQARSAFCRPYDGTGLGLSVVRGLLGLHGGTIAVESEIGKGTLVTVRLPFDCRVVTATAAPLIETIARRQSSDVFSYSPEPRMKQIA